MGAIGYGLPAATGAALALRGSGRRVLALQADGSGLYSPQALWTMAREGLDVTVVVMANAAYRILQVELARGGTSTDGRGGARADRPVGPGGRLGVGWRRRSACRRDGPTAPTTRPRRCASRWPSSGPSLVELAVQ